MKILFVTMQYGQGYVQGTERYLGGLGACLRERGHQVSYLGGDPLRRHGRTRLGEPLQGGAGGEEQLHAYPSRGWMAVSGISRQIVRKWLEVNRPDLVHVANPAHIGVGVMSACRELGIPVVVTIMDFWWLCPKATLLRADGRVCEGQPGWATCTQCIAADSRRGWVRRAGSLPRFAAPATLALMFARSACRGLTPAEMWRWTRRREFLLKELASAEQVLFPSHAVASSLQRLLPAGRCRMLAYGIASEWFANPRPQRTAPADPVDLTIGFAGTLLPHKGPHVLLDAVRMLGWTQTRVRLAGPAPDTEYLRSLQQRAAGLNVEFTGALPGEKMPEFLRSLDALAMTSLWPENLPFIVLEAQAAGVPVVAGRVAGVAEQVGSDNLLFEPGSAEGLARALKSVRAHPEAVPAAQVRTLNQMTDETEAVYREAVGRCTSGKLQASR